MVKKDLGNSLSTWAEPTVCLHFARLSPILSHLILNISHFNDKEKGSEWFGNLPTVTQPVSGRDRIRTQNSDVRPSVSSHELRRLSQSEHGLI